MPYRTGPTEDRDMTRLSNKKAEHSNMLCGFDSWQRQEIPWFYYHTGSGTHPQPCPMKREALFRGWSWPLSSLCARVKNTWRYTSAPSVCLHRVDRDKVTFFIRWAIRTGGCADQHSAALYNYVIIHNTQILRTWISLRTNIQNSHALFTSTASDIVLILFSHHLQKFPNVSQLRIFVHSTYFLRYLLIYCQCPCVQSVHLHDSELLQHADGMI
jgi:hypothetical protein